MDKTSEQIGFGICGLRELRTLERDVGKVPETLFGDAMIIVEHLLKELSLAREAFETVGGLRLFDELADTYKDMIWKVLERINTIEMHSR